MKKYILPEELKNALLILATQRATGTYQELNSIVKGIEDLEEIEEK